MNAVTKPAHVTIVSLSTVDAVAAIPSADRIHTRHDLAAWRMFRALANVPCACQHNVPYAGMSEPQFVTVQCGRCKAMAAWLELQPLERVTVSTAEGAPA